MDSPMKLRLSTREDPAEEDAFKILVQVMSAPELTQLLRDLDAINDPYARIGAALIRRFLELNREAERS